MFNYTVEIRMKFPWYMHGSYKTDQGMSSMGKYHRKLASSGTKIRSWARSNTFGHSMMQNDDRHAKAAWMVHGIHRVSTDFERDCRVGLR